MSRRKADVVSSMLCNSFVATADGEEKKADKDCLYFVIWGFSSDLFESAFCASVIFFLG